MAYGICEESIAQYLIEHAYGADQNALDEDGRKPIDCIWILEILMLYVANLY